MTSHRLFWGIYAATLGFALVFLGAASWYSDTALRRFYHAELRHELAARGRMMESILPPALSPLNVHTVDSLCKKLFAATATRFTVIAADGRVLGDSERQPTSMENHLTRPEVKDALQNGWGESDRFSTTLRTDMLYVAHRVKSADSTTLIIRAAFPLASINKVLAAVHTRIIVAGIFLALLAAVAAYVFSRRLSRPIETLSQSAQRIAQGELSTRAVVNQRGEVGVLATAMNTMASQLNNQIAAITRQHNEQQAVLCSMVEGVIAVDAEEKIILINLAALRLLGLEQSSCTGRWISEVVRNSDLRKFIELSIVDEAVSEREIAIVGNSGGDIYVQAHGTALADTNNMRIGAVVVLNDITRLKKLETIRRDFVANVSHELKTPLTLINGFVETILNGGVDTIEETRRLLGIVKEQGDRLNTIIDDLLSLSRLEQDAAQHAVSLEEEDCIGIIHAAIRTCEFAAQQKHIAITVAGPSRALARVNCPLLEEAVINLIDNAVKYSSEGHAITVAVSQNDRETAIAVADQGVGIAQEHRGRIFERFYRVDKARSRTSGGTGLGLSIVKHIMAVHGGSVTVESAVGSGSTFTLHLPVVT